MIYKSLARPLFFLVDAEITHNAAIRLGQFIGKIPLAKCFLKQFYTYKHPKLKSKVLGIKFENPIGLAAGFDKNALIPDVMPLINFGHVEVGSVTGEPCKGNPKPRMWRLPKEKALVVNYGLCNDGAEAIARRLKGKKFEIPVGISIARTNRPEFIGKKGIEDYIKAFKLMQPIADYIAINVSCPNLADNYSFGNPENLDSLLKAIGKEKINKPVLLKIKPDYTNEELDKIIVIVKKYSFIKGFILTNLTKKNRSGYEGAISGVPIKNRSTNVIRYVYKKTKGQYTIIGVGGIFSAEDAYEKIRAGASLVQLITGMIYEGPYLIKKINRDLVKLLEEDGFSNISEAIGIDVK